MPNRRRPGVRSTISPKAVRATLTIRNLAHRGDGVAETEHGPVFVAGALPGETVIADVIGERGVLLSVVEEAAERIIPPCPHFGSCGGCSLQHMAPAFYQRWKRDVVSRVLASQDVDCAVDPLEPIAAGTRRRATFAAEWQGKALAFGFHGARSHSVVALDACLILDPRLAGRLDELRALAALIAPRRGVMKLHALLTESGLDIRLDDFGPWPDFATERKLMDFATQSKLARISLGDRVLIAPQTPVLHFGTAAVTPPPGGFTQAATLSENRLAALVMEAAGRAKHVADLFAGSGTFSLRLALSARVHAVDGDAASIEALTRAASATPALKPLTTERRDLFRRPLMAKELDVFDLALLDPPRAGAREQIAEIAKSKLSRLVYVSCSPASFARDAATLQGAGFTLARTTPVDQFLYSHHIELVGVFNRER